MTKLPLIMPYFYRFDLGKRNALTFLLFISSLVSFAQTDCKSTKHVGHGPGAKRDHREVAPIDLVHQRISLDLTLGNIIVGECAIRAVPREDLLDHFALDLAALTVDSVTHGGGTLAFTHNGELLDILFDAPIGSQDTIDLIVHYHGDPIVDPSGFGGFYTATSLTYNLGVAFQSVPHSYGRVWFPCLDNFTERNTYEFLIKTSGGRKAWCNGELVEYIPLGGDTIVSHWRIDETIPSYLASVAAANFAVARDTFPNISGSNTPVELIAFPGDTTGMKNSFIHLEDAFDHFEALFGPYRWDRVGYVLTPNGAMEHATSIHYPRSIATGSLQYEATMAHELAHHWFGNLVTCDRAEEMYINEGFAEYLSYLFLEQVHGRQRYITEVRNNHRSMVHRAHLIDQGWWALSEMPQEWTYGEHSYNKGADVLHTLRSYLGDEAFSTGLTSFMEAYAFEPVNTEILRDHLGQATGTDLTDFFADWVQQPGWAAFEIDAVTTTPDGDGYEVELGFQQKLRGPASFYHNVPVTIASFGADPSIVQRDTVLLGGEFTQLTIHTPFEPTMFWLNDDDRISLAITGVTDTIGATGSINSSIANIELISQGGDSVVVRIDQYWVAPDEGSSMSPTPTSFLLTAIGASAAIGPMLLGSPAVCSTTDATRQVGTSTRD
ncbi:MAG: M1 family metallopeptidase [Flavobacteriales bacterium]